MYTSLVGAGLSGFAVATNAVGVGSVGSERGYAAELIEWRTGGADRGTTQLRRDTMFCVKRVSMVVQNAVQVNTNYILQLGHIIIYFL